MNDGHDILHEFCFWGTVFVLNENHEFCVIFVTDEVDGFESKPAQSVFVGNQQAVDLSLQDVSKKLP